MHLVFMIRTVVQQSLECNSSLFWYLVRLLQTAHSGAEIGVWCLVRMKKVQIDVGNNLQNSAIKKWIKIRRMM